MNNKKTSSFITGLIFVLAFTLVLGGVIIVCAIFEVPIVVAMIICFMLVIGILCLVSKINNTACPKCQKRFAMKEISRKTIDMMPTTVNVRKNIYNYKGEITGSYDQAVPATRYIFQCTDECKYCGHQVLVKRERTARD